MTRKAQEYVTEVDPRLDPDRGPLQVLRSPEPEPERKAS